MDRKRIAIAMMVLALLAIGSAYGVSVGLERALEVPEMAAMGDVLVVPAEEGIEKTEVPSHPSVLSGLVTLTRSQYLDGILRRNIFDSDAIAVYTPGSGLNGGEGIKTDLRVTLLATIVAAPAAASSALISEEDRGAQGYGIGDNLFDAEIITIEQKRVTIRRGDGSMEYISMDGEGTKKVADGKKSGAGDESGVEKLDENKYAISRELLESQLANMDALSRMGRALLHRGADGEYDGYRLSAVRRNSLPDQLGIRNGDIIHSVNGMALNSVQGAMNAYQSLMTEGSFAFEVSRRGERINLEYEVQ